MEEQLKNDEIEKLKKIDEAILDKAIGTNPMFDQIEQCEHLKKFCQKQMNKDSEPATSKAEDKEVLQQKIKGDLEKAIAKGSIQLA